MNKPEIALQKVAPSLAIIISGEQASELTQSHFVDMPSIESAINLALDTEITGKVIISKHGTGCLWKIHNPVKKTGLFKGYIPFILITDGFPIMPSMTIVEKSLLLMGIEVDGQLYFALAESGDVDDH